MTEPWLTGRLAGIHLIQAALLYSFEQARQDLMHWTAGLDQQQLWRKAGDVASVGFHVRHIAGSVDRLITYATGEQLSPQQMIDLHAEQHATGPDREALMANLEEKLSRAEQIVRGLNPAKFEGVREIGRKRIEVPLGVLLIHISEHTQRHVGAAIVTAKIAKQ